MIIACPACTTRYAIPDSAIGVEGRTVRCAKCRHSWFQDGPDVQAPQETSAPIPAPTPMPPSVAPPPPSAPAAPPPSLAPSPVLSTPEDFAESPSSFDHHPPFRARRNPAKLWTGLAIGFAVVTTAAMGAVAEFGLPTWLPLPQASSTQPDLKLSFPAEKQERRPLSSGNDFFNIAGTITNIGKERRAVPALILILRDSRNRAVYTREVAPPKPVLAPGESQTVNTAIVDAPKAAVAAEVQWKQH